MDISNPLVYGVPIFVLFVLAELIYSKARGDYDLYEWKDLFSSSAMGLGAVALAPFLKLFSAAVIFTAVYEVFNPLVDGVRMNIMGYKSFEWAWYTLLICQFLDDFAYYWFHRANHEVRVFWAAHIVHHSSHKFNFGTGIRNGWVTLMYKPLFYMWIPAIGFPPEMVVLTLGIEALWQFQLHSRYVPKMGIFEKILNTHTMHQVHHAQNIPYLDKNHGGYLNIFDKMFGTWKELDEDEVDTKYGVIHPPDSYNPLVIVGHEYRDIFLDVIKSRSIREVFMYIFGPPGWSPDGSTKTVKELQKEYEEQIKAYKSAKEKGQETIPVPDSILLTH